MIVPEENMDLPDYTEGASERIGIEEQNPKHVLLITSYNVLR